MEKFILDFLTFHSETINTFGYYIVFLSGLIESFPAFGFFIPGQTIVVIGGFLATEKSFSFILMFLIASLGAILGDIISFFLGRKYGEEILHKHGGKFFVKESLIKNTKELIKIHPGKTLFFGRLNGVTRSLSPFLAGTSKVSLSTFLFFCITGGIAWAGIFVSLGFIFGKSLIIMSPIIGKFILLATLLVGTVIILVQYMRKKGFTLSNYDIQILVTNIVSLYVFVSIAEAVSKASQIINSFDLKINHTVFKMHTYFADHFMLVISKIDQIHFIISTLILCLILIFHKKLKDSFSLSLSLVIGYVLVFWTKIIFEKPRPLLGLIYEDGYSFPSGHATLSTLFFLIFIHTFAHKIKNTFWRFIFVTLNITMIGIISFSRIYLGVHFATDVIAGIALGSFVFSFSLLASKCAPWLYKKIKREQIIPNL